MARIEGKGPAPVGGQLPKPTDVMSLAQRTATASNRVLQMPPAEGKTFTASMFPAGAQINYLALMRTAQET